MACHYADWTFALSKKQISTPTSLAAPCVGLCVSSEYVAWLFQKMGKFVVSLVSLFAEHRNGALLCCKSWGFWTLISMGYICIYVCVCVLSFYKHTFSDVHTCRLSLSTGGRVSVSDKENYGESVANSAAHCLPSTGCGPNHGQGLLRICRSIVQEIFPLSSHFSELQSVTHVSPECMQTSFAGAGYPGA